MMLQHYSPLIPLALCVACASLSSAQHDPQRNATQAIALEDFKKAEKQLANADDTEPETHFVRMMLSLKRGDVDAGVKLAEQAIDAGLPFSRLVAGPRDLLAPLYETEAFQKLKQQHADLAILHGPMLGRVTDSAASFWVRTATAAQVQVKVGEHTSDVVNAVADTDFTATVMINGLTPGTRYEYQVLVDGRPVKVPNAQFRTFPKAGNPCQFSVAFGGGAGYVPKWERMWDTISKFEPAALLMLGDNVYIDQPEHLLCQHYCYYRRQSRPEWRRLVASTPTYAIYDDHDFGTNDCVPGPEIDSPAWKRIVWNKFRENWINPAYGGGEKQPGCWFDFQIGDVHFILIDGRYYRDRKGGSMLGPAQKAWLFDTLENSRGTFKVIASPVPWTSGVKPGSKDPWDGFPEEREEIFSFIESRKLDGVFLISADRHRTDLRRTNREEGYNLFEFESSRLTNRHTHKVVKTPGLIWGYNQKCSFGLMRFDTTGDSPSVRFECINIDGERIHSYELFTQELKH